MHNIYNREYSYDVNKASVQEYWDEVVRHEDYQEGATGLNAPISWKDLKLKNYSEAKKWIEEHDYSYAQLAVSYYSNDVLKTSSETKRLKQQLEKEKKMYNELNNRIHYSSKNVKSNFVSCPRCESKISTKWVRSNSCPICGAELRPQSTLDRIKLHRNKLNDLERKLKISENEDYKANKRGKGLQWLVKVEYHT